jgi:hypothetical protein
MDSPERSLKVAESGGRPVLRAELIIAALALVASACASIAAIVQTRESDVQTRAAIDQARVVAKQLDASLWPYLTIDQSFSPKAVRVSLTDQGLGPALIRTLTISIDGRRKVRLRDVLDFLDSPRASRNIRESDFGPGSVLRPSQTFETFGIYDAALANAGALQSAMRHVTLSVCYCSLLDNCWSLRSTDTQPQAVRNCPRQSRKLAL